MKNKINKRLSAIAILAVMTTAIAITAIEYSLFQKQVKADLKLNAILLKDTRFFDSPDIDQNEIDLSTDIDDLRITWIARSGAVLYDNDVEAQDLENHLDRPEIKDAFADGDGESVRRSSTLNKDTFYYALRLDNGTVLRVAVNAQSLWSIFLSAAPVMLTIIALIIGVCVALSRMLTKQLLRPIEMMAEDLDSADYTSPYRELDPFAEKLKAQHADVLAAAKARQDFTANVSHELKTPLTAISGYAELLGNDMAEESQKKRFYQEIHRNSQRLLALINDIIRLSDLDRTDQERPFEKVDLSECVKECTDELQISASQRKITLEYKTGDCFIYGSKEMIRELIENLIQNAIRYNNPGGSVTVETAMVDNRPSLTVRDDGIGIPLTEQKHIFERFYRVDKSRSKATGGTGLGLAIVKHIVEIHHGEIKVESEPGIGTTVVVLF